MREKERGGGRELTERRFDKVSRTRRDWRCNSGEEKQPMWIRLSDKRMEIAAPCGCLQTFFVTPEFDIERTALASRCRKDSCEYNYAELLVVALRVTACLRKAKPYQPEMAAVSASSYDMVG